MTQVHMVQPVIPFITKKIADFRPLKASQFILLGFSSCVGILALSELKRWVITRNRYIHGSRVSNCNRPVGISGYII